MSLQIRRARRADWERLVPWTGWPEVAGGMRRTLRLYRNVVADQAYDLYVADEGGEAVGVGAVSYVRALALGGQRATLEEVVVRADRRRGGVGRALVEHLTRRVSRRGARRLEASPTSAEAEAFLVAVGFERVQASFRRRLEV